MELKDLETKLTEFKTVIETQVTSIVGQTGDKAEAVRKALDAELVDVKKAIHSMEEQMKVAAARNIPGLKDELKAMPFDFGMAASAIYKEKMGISEPWKDAGHEKEIISNTMKVRANTAGDGAAGGYLIPDEATTDFIDLAEASMPIMSLGINIIRGLTGDLPVPIKTSRTTAYMVGENSKPTESQVAYGERILRPKKIGAFTKQSNRLINQSRGVSDRIIKADLAYSFKKKLEEQMLFGLGTEYQAKGILTHTGTTATSNSMGSNGGRFTIDNASKMITDLDCVDEMNTPGGQYGFLFHPRVKAGMKRERVITASGATTSTGLPILANNLLMTDAILSDQLGTKIASTSLMPLNTVGTSTTCAKTIFGNWNLFWLGMWRDMVMKVSDQAGDGSTGSAFLDDQLYIVLFQEIDCLIMRPSAFTITTGCETTETSW